MYNVKNTKRFYTDSKPSSPGAAGNIRALRIRPPDRTWSSEDLNNLRWVNRVLIHLSQRDRTTFKLNV